MRAVRWRRRPLLPRTLRARLTWGLVTLLAVVGLAVVVTAAPTLRGFLVERLDEQLAATDGRFASSLEHEREPEGGEAGHEADTRGQAEGTFGAWLKDGAVPRAAVVGDDAARAVPLTAADRETLADIPVDGQGYTTRISSLGEYRVTAVSGKDGDTLVTGLPLHEVHELVERLQLTTGLVFSVALAVTGLAGAVWVRLSLRPLDRMAATASEVTRLPLASGQVAMPPPVPDSDPDTEVGRVGAALNQMLGHVGDALARRQASQERLRQFAADASHELRTPVAAVRGHAELALRQPEETPPAVRRSLERIESESRRMTGLVDDLLLLARLDAGRALADESVDLSRLALDAVDDARVVGPDHRWLLDLPEEPVVVTGDGQRLHQVLTNLLTNAHAHTPPGTEVVVRVSAGPGGVELTVTDDGPGIPESLRPEVFTRFTRGDQGRSRAAGGTGLGLAIVAAVAEAHGGTVDVSSRPGRTTFSVRLPAVPPRPPQGRHR